MIFEPKPRLVMSQSVADKIVNHFVANYYLLPYLESSLIDSNVATRKNKGSKYALDLLERYLNTIRLKNKNKEIYCLKVDISKYFYTIDHQLLLEKLKKKIQDEKVLDLLKKIMDETDKDYVNELVRLYNKKFQTQIPLYKKGVGLSIGVMTSQFLAIFYLNDLDHYIKEKLLCKYYIRYMDDFLVLDTDLEKLKKVWKEIENKLQNLNLVMNPKSNIFRLTNGFSFLGYRYRIVNKKLEINYHKKTIKKIRNKLIVLYSYDLLKYYKTYSSYYGYLKKVREIERRFIMKTKEKFEYYKQKYPKSIILIKEGTFYKTYENDALILWYIFGYKWNHDCISFGSSPYMKVLEKLSCLSLSYGVIKEEELFITNNDEVYDLYLQLASINYEKQKKKKELIDLLETTFDKHNDLYDTIKDFLIGLEE